MARRRWERPFTWLKVKTLLEDFLGPVEGIFGEPARGVSGASGTAAGNRLDRIEEPSASPRPERGVTEDQGLIYFQRDTDVSVLRQGGFAGPWAGRPSGLDRVGSYGS